MKGRTARYIAISGAVLLFPGILSGCSRPQADAWNKSCDALQEMINASILDKDGAKANAFLTIAASEAQKAAEIDSDEFYTRLRDDVVKLKEDGEAKGSVDYLTTKLILEDDCLRKDN